MYTKAIDLKEFYDTTRGRVVQRILRQHLRRLWPSVHGLRVLGFGYAVPFLKPLMADAERVIALMPAHQGAVFWPDDGRANDKNLVALCHEGEMPIETNSIDRLLVVHGLPGYESLDAVLREAWRVLSGQGSLILIVPNRSGVWARFDNNPFGHGAPWSVGQIKQALKDYMFVPEQSQGALFVPPSSSRLMLAASFVWEKLGQRFFGAFGGVNIIVATKQLYAGTPVAVTSSGDIRRKLVTAARPFSKESLE